VTALKMFKKHPQTRLFINNRKFSNHLELEKEFEGRFFYNHKSHVAQNLKKNDLLIIDEIQRCDKEFIEKLLEKGVKIIGFGDENQVFENQALKFKDLLKKAKKITHVGMFRQDKEINKIIKYLVSNNKKKFTIGPKQILDKAVAKFSSINFEKKEILELNDFREICICAIEITLEKKFKKKFFFTIINDLDIFYKNYKENSNLKRKMCTLIETSKNEFHRNNQTDLKKFGMSILNSKNDRTFATDMNLYEIGTCFNVVSFELNWIYIYIDSEYNNDFFENELISGELYTLMTRAKIGVVIYCKDIELYMELNSRFKNIDTSSIEYSNE